MTPVSFTCEACGEVLAVSDKTRSEPVLRLATGLTFRTDGSAACSGCGHETKVNSATLERRSRAPYDLGATGRQ